jgi:hypothetical protein
VAYRADIEIAVKGAQELKRLQNEINNTSKLVNSLNDYIENFSGTGIVRSINTLRTAVAGAAAEFNKVALGTEEAVIAARKYVSATNELNAELRERAALLKTINEEERKNRLAAIGREVGGRPSGGYGGPIGPGPASPVGALVGQKSPVAERIRRDIAGRQDQLQLEQALLRLEEKSAEQLNRQLQTRKELARTAALEVNTLIAKAAAGPQAAQLLLSAAAPGAPAMGGGARRRITGPVERLGGARTADEAAMAVRFAQALEEQTRPLSQIQALYAGIAGEAAKLQSIKALPDSQMLNASARGIKQLETAEDMLNRERQETVTRLREIDRLEESRARRARKLQERQQYVAGAPAETPAATRGGLSSRASGAISSALIGGGFPLLFGQGPAAAAGGAVGGLAGGLVGGGFGFALSIVGTALGDAAEKADTFNKQLAVLNSRVAGTGNAVKITSKDVDSLAKTFGVANDEAIKLLQNFAGFGDANVTKSLAFVYGDDASILKGLAAAKDQADLAQVILGAYEKIGIERATQLINQIKLGDSAAVELAFQKALLDARIKQTEEGLKQITIQDRIVAGLATAASFMGGGQGQIVDPAVFGQERVNQFRRTNQPSSIFTNAFQGLRQLRSATQGVESLRPDKGADKAARDAEREAQRVAQVVRERNAEASILRIQSTFQQRIADAELKRDPLLVARLQGEERMVALQYQYAKELANEKNIEAQVAIMNEAKSAMKKQQLDNELRLRAIYEEQKRAATETIDSLKYELELRNATTEAERNRLRIAYEMKALQGQVDPNAFPEIEALKKQIAAPETAGEIIQKRIGALQDELLKLTNIGNIAVTVADSIGTAFSQAFQGIISGTMTAQEALASFFQSVGDAFIQMASEIIAKQISMIILQSILKALGAPVGGGGGGTNAISNFNLGAAQYGGGLAGGGPTRAGTPYLVGERGPELFVPGTNGGVMSNSDLRSSMGAAPGSAGGSPVLNMSFETSTINGVEYVSRDQLEAAMAQTRRQAARDGASRGMSMTLDKLQQSPSTRKRVGF